MASLRPGPSPSPSSSIARPSPTTLTWTSTTRRAVSEDQAEGVLKTYMSLHPETASGTKLAIDGGGLFTILSYLLPTDVSGTHLSAASGTRSTRITRPRARRRRRPDAEDQVIFGGACGTVLRAAVPSRAKSLPRVERLMTYVPLLSPYQATTSSTTTRDKAVEGQRAARHSGEHARLRRPRRYGQVR